MDIILFQPQIPQNTGNIVRTCSITNSNLILVRPLGFSVTQRQLKRAGLDYWDEVCITQIDDLQAYLEKEKRPFYFFSSKAEKKYSDISYTKDDILIFGSETSGLPLFLNGLYPDHFVTIPMKTGVRCLNLSNAVAVGLFEAFRQIDFDFG
ncbi:MAG: tRNA (cytidine(34)-2'-O)-methyltransferase [Chlamydiota bacterium]